MEPAWSSGSFVIFPVVQIVCTEGTQKPKQNKPPSPAGKCVNAHGIMESEERVTLVTVGERPPCRLLPLPLSLLPPSPLPSSPPLSLLPSFPTWNSTTSFYELGSGFQCVRPEKRWVCLGTDLATSKQQVVAVERNGIWSKHSDRAELEEPERWQLRLTKCRRGRGQKSASSLSACQQPAPQCPGGRGCPSGWDVAGLHAVLFKTVWSPNHKKPTRAF